MNKNFLAYSQYYDLLYKDKDYGAEANFIISLLKNLCPQAKTILNLGCGTGEHDHYFANSGYEVTGIDLSNEMLEIAIDKNKGVAFHYQQGDVRNINLKKKFDVVISLFHVLSYQSSDEDVLQFFKTVKKHLNQNGVSIFDYWYAPAVVNLKAENKVKKLNSDELEITRITTSNTDYVSSVVNVDFKITIKNKKTKTNTELKELHKMRFFTLNEINLLAKMNQLEGTHRAWLETEKLPTIETWSAYSIFKNIH